MPINVKFEYIPNVLLVAKMDKVLVQIREMLTPPEHWIKHVSAIDNRGIRVEASDPMAVCWCLSGAVFKLAAPDRLQRPIYMLLADAIEGNENPTFWSIDEARDLVIDFNDTHRHDEVIGVIDKAIEMARDAR